MSDDERRAKEEKDRKKAEVRKRLEEASRAKKNQTKKGFMTPERKKKLRLLLRKKAADELKKEQERKAEARKKIIGERCGQAKNIDGSNEATLQTLMKEYYSRITKLEDAKYDLEFEVRQKDYQINELSIQVNDLRGKFVKPALKKVSKYDTKFSKMKALQAKANEMSFRANLKSVGNKFKMEEEEKEKPQWALGGKKEGDAKAEAGGEEE